MIGMSSFAGMAAQSKPRTLTRAQPIFSDFSEVARS